MPKSSSFGTPSGGHQDVAGLEVAVDDQVLVGEVDGRADLPEELQALAHRQLPVVAVLVDRPPLDVLHDEVGAAVLGGAAVEQLGDVRMVEVGEDLALGAEAADDLVGVHAAPDELDRDPLLELLVGPLRQVDRRPCRRGRSRARSGRRRCAARRRAAPPPPGRMRKTGVSMKSPSSVSEATNDSTSRRSSSSPRQASSRNSRPFGAFPLQGAVEDDFDLLPALGCHRSPGAAAAPVVLSVFLKRESRPGNGSRTGSPTRGSARGTARAWPSATPA